LFTQKVELHGADKEPASKLPVTATDTTGETMEYLDESLMALEVCVRTRFPIAVALEDEGAVMSNRRR